MRRFLFGVVIASVTAAMPAWALGGDREIAQSVIAELQQHKAAGELKGFDIDLKVEDGVVYLTGEVASRAQRAIVERAVLNEVSEANVVNELRVKGSQPVKASQPAAAARPIMVMPVSGTEESGQATATDMAVTDTIIEKLQQSKASGALRGFDLDVSTVQGDVWLKGSVANQTQKDLILDVARRTPGVARVVDDVIVKSSSPIRQVSTGAPEPIPQGSSMPVAGRPMASPQAFAPSGVAGYCQDGGYISGGPMPIQGAGGEYGVGAPRYDQPNLPSYAWPSYAAHPNYAAVTYPKQYSPSAWPYIGPFYPYPQVPLGWRKVALEWDDGLWYLDFTSK
ncbi:MAG: BON domain-containing protein [Pirellulaceae bacterium]|jgi:osmotically-inducible protein OsmY|nr:BON domain-containing protein [Pirellulaceae bacterium]